MKITKVIEETLGICPRCHEWTTAGDSCCGRGAVVEGGYVSDEAAQEDALYNTYCVLLLTTKHYKLANVFKKLIDKLGFSTTLTGFVIKKEWSLRLFISFKK